MAKLCEDIIKDFVNVRSAITLGAFACIYILVIKGKLGPDVVLHIADTLLGFWFGQKVATAIKEKGGAQ
jgi:hypothetical protein